jgi:hypothetical protein
MGISDIISAGKNLIEIVQKSDNLDIIKKSLEFQQKTLELVVENQSLKEKINKLENILKASKELLFRSPFYFHKDDKIPYCPRCWEDFKKQIHLVINESDAWKSYECPSCSFQNIDKKNGYHSNRTNDNEPYY